MLVAERVVYVALLLLQRRADLPTALHVGAERWEEGLLLDQLHHRIVVDAGDEESSVGGLGCNQRGGGGKRGGGVRRVGWRIRRLRK